MQIACDGTATAAGAVGAAAQSLSDRAGDPNGRAGQLSLLCMITGAWSAARHESTGSEDERVRIEPESRVTLSRIKPHDDGEKAAHEGRHAVGEARAQGETLIERWLASRATA
jgi:hypothetical protein